MYTRINQRVDIMMQHGLLTEAKGLYANIRVECLQTVGYRELFSYLNGDSANLLSKRSKKIQGALLSDKSPGSKIKPRNGTILKRHIKQL
jgi:hypothetical protein